MLRRVVFLLAIAALLSTASVVGAQVVRFQTTVGDFDLVLNPTSNPLLQEHVDNMLHYVLSGRYDNTVIHRAVDNFVLQMGVFETMTPAVPSHVSGFVPIETYAPIQGVPAVEVGLSNIAGTVGLALSGGPSGTNQDSGTSSFFVNLNSNSFLDNDFAVFARVANMATINAIMAVPTVDLASIPSFGAGAGNLAFTDVPKLANGNLVFINKAFVVQSFVDPKGDYNANGKVDAADYVVWRNSKSTGVIGAGLIGDGNRNGVVDGADFDLWRKHFGGTTIAAGTQLAVPEPAIWVLLGAVLPLWLMRRAWRD
jgi:cyclophilin family peptidyl-prolyl cis-trans isomerase